MRLSNNFRFCARPRCPPDTHVHVVVATPQPLHSLQSRMLSVTFQDKGSALVAFAREPPAQRTRRAHAHTCVQRMRLDDFVGVACLMGLPHVLVLNEADGEWDIAVGGFDETRNLA